MESNANEHTYLQKLIRFSQQQLWTWCKNRNQHFLTDAQIIKQHQNWVHSCCWTTQNVRPTFDSDTKKCLEIWNQNPDLRTLSYPIMIDYKQIQHKTDILSHVGIVGFFSLQLLFFCWRTKGSACSLISQLLKESMDTSTTSDQYTLVLCQPREKG